jgi:hypothetical protein
VDREFPSSRSGEVPHDETLGGDYTRGMKPTAANPNATTQRQKKDSRLNTGPGAATTRRRTTTAATSASEKATASARRGEPLKAKNKSERSPKQENL